MRTRVRAISVVVLLTVAAASGSRAQAVEQEWPQAGRGEPASLAAPAEIRAVSPAETSAKTEVLQAPGGEEGIPFAWNLEGVKFANAGFVHLRHQRFAEAEQAYAQAKERDERYQGFYEKVVWLRDSAAQGKLDEARKEMVRDDLDLTWAQLLGWEREERPSTMPGLRVWAKDAQGNLISMPIGPTRVRR